MIIYHSTTAYFILSHPVLLKHRPIARCSKNEMMLSALLRLTKNMIRATFPESNAALFLIVVLR